MNQKLDTQLEEKGKIVCYWKLSDTQRVEETLNRDVTGERGNKVASHHSHHSHLESEETGT